MFSTQQLPSACSSFSFDPMNRMLPVSSCDPMCRMMCAANPMERLSMELMAADQVPISRFQAASPYEIMQGDDKMARIEKIKRIHQLAMDKFAGEMNPVSHCGMNPMPQCGMNSYSYPSMPRIKPCLMSEAQNFNPVQQAILTQSGLNPLLCGLSSRLPTYGMNTLNPFGPSRAVQSLFSCNPSLGASDIQKLVKLKVNVNQPLISFSDPQFAMKYGHPMWN